MMEKKLSVIQRYVLFALAKKPGVYVFHKDEMGVGLYVAGVMELLGADVAALDEKGRLRLEKPLPADLAYLTPLYETLEELRPQKPAAAAKKYVATFLNRRMNELALSVAESLERTGSLVREERSGLFGETVRYPVPAEVLNDQVEALRKTILSSGPLEDGDVVLAVLLKHAKLLKRFFSKFESDQLKKRLKEIKKSDSSRMAKQIQSQIDAVYAATAAAAAASAAH